MLAGQPASFVVWAEDVVCPICIMYSRAARGGCPGNRDQEQCNQANVSCRECLAVSVLLLMLAAGQFELESPREAIMSGPYSAVVTVRSS